MFDNLALHDRFARHARTICPLRKIQALASQDPAGWSLRPVASFIYHVFPATIVAVEPYHVSLFRLRPQAPDRTTIHATVLVTPEKLRVRDNLIKDIALLKDGLREDSAIGETIQAGIGAGADEAFTFGAYEGALAHFHRGVDELINPS